MAIAIPSAFQAPTNHNWVSSLELQTVVGVHAPEVMESLIPRYGNQNITGLMEMQGSMNPVQAQLYTHFEENRLHTVVQFDAHAAGGANLATTLTIAAAYQYTYPTTAQAPYITTTGAVTTNPLIVNQVVEFPNEVRALVTAVSSSTATLVPIVSGEEIPQVFTGTVVIIIGNAHEEGSGQPLGRNSNLSKYENNLMIMKAKASSTGTEMGQAVWFPLKDQNGKTGYVWYYKAQFDEYTRFRNEREMMMLLGKKITNTTLAALVPTNTVTEGLLPFIENYGNNYGYSAITGIQLADMELISAQLDSQRGDKENTMWCGFNLNLGVDAFMRDTMKNGAISYGVFGGSKEKAIDFGFDSFVIGNYTYHKKTYDLFNDPTLLGADGFPYKNMALIMPATKVGAHFSPGSKEKTMVPSLRINYLKGKGTGYSREMEEWLTGGVDGVYTNEDDVRNYNMRSHWGFEGFGANRFFKVFQQ